MPAPQNFGAAAGQQAQASQYAVDQQTQQNRINQNNGFATTSYGPNGQQTSFNGPLGGLSTNLQAQAAQAMGTPFSLDGLPPAIDPSQAREQAINSAYGQASSRLDPQFAQQETALKAQLAGQGLAPGSQAYNDALSNFGRQKNDAYNGALSSAVGQGTQAGNALFNQSIQSRQNALMEMLRSRGQAFGELQGLQGLSQQQGYNQAGRAETPQYLQAAGMQGAQDWQRYLYEQQQIADGIKGGVGLATSLAPLALGLPPVPFKL
jgi:hypothetical protein